MVNCLFVVQKESIFATDVVSCLHVTVMAYCRMFLEVMPAIASSLLVNEILEVCKITAVFLAYDWHFSSSRFRMVRDRFFVA